MTELYFKGKEFVYNHHLTVPHRPLEMHADKGIGDPRLDGNLILQGDNLHALKALLPLYAGKVDCIFIDPPYNTGNESWSYNDNVNAPMIKEWLASNPIQKDDGLRHDKWCAMMWPRVRLLKELLSDTGLIAATIDSNELDNMLVLFDEIFGSENRLAVGVWQSDPSGGKQKSSLRVGHEFIVFYGGGSPDLTKEKSAGSELNLEDHEGAYCKGRELNKWGANSLRENRPTMFFPLVAPDGSDVFPIRGDGKEGCWRLGAENPLMKSLIKGPESAHWEMRPFDKGVVVDGATERWVPYEKIRNEERAFGWSTWLSALATTADGTRTVAEIFGSSVFETPKPVQLLDFVVRLIANDDAVFLDSFAGTGTTAHAVLRANREDSGTRKFILVQMDEGEGKVNADELTAERVRRVINGYEFTGTQKTELLREKLNWKKLQSFQKIEEQVEKIENLHGHEYDTIKKTVKDGELIVTGEKKVDERAEGLGGEFTYCTLGAPIEMDKILTGETLPPFVDLATVLFHTATNLPGDPAKVDADAFFMGEANGQMLWLVYKPELDWLKTPNAALSLSFARKIAEEHPKARHLVFAPANHTNPKILAKEGLKVEFSPLPYALYRVEKA
ncbi:site-specific DNA-methyltransferase [Paracoccus sp. SM22M-07]|uniref:site-specific DNA-methyltransferase n=1 Tax=Paracoccus sp. SM22M-07 TaxID=1520813 RepID=UPI00091985AF|nr:site-specific DNA-methyltransferase [Paracoccus sp. SM22M-07]OJH43446.1 hypothetical protein IE00_16835 [Paracoccus sp. SM22M-07]